MEKDAANFEVWDNFAGAESWGNDVSYSAQRFEFLDEMLVFCVVMKSQSWETQWTIVFLKEAEK